MPAMIDALRAEHKTMAKVLKVIEGELKTFEAGDAPDYDLVLMALDYLQDFPELVHHPKEDLVYTHLKRQRADMAEMVKGLDAEHRDIATKVQAFRQAIDRVLEEEEISREVIITRGQDLLSTHWTHMREEEERFFPLCERCLAASDWADIMLEASDRPDPMLAGHAAQHLDLLRERILAL